MSPSCRVGHRRASCTLRQRISRSSGAAYTTPQPEPVLCWLLLDGARLRWGEAAFGAVQERGRPWSLAEAMARAFPMESALAGLAKGARPEVPSPTPEAALTRLTPAKLDVLRLIAAGLSNKQIAARHGPVHRQRPGEDHLLEARRRATHWCTARLTGAERQGGRPAVHRRVLVPPNHA